MKLSESGSLKWLGSALIVLLFALAGIAAGMADRDFFHTEWLSRYAFIWMISCFLIAFVLTLVGAVKGIFGEL